MKATGHIKNLIEINNDRTLGFRKALEELEPINADLKIVFAEYAADSEGFSTELTRLASEFGKEVDADDESIAGAIHRAWIDVKSLFGGKDRKAILEEAERGEDAIKAAYKKVLDSGDLGGETLSVISEQAARITSAHDKIKALRDNAK